MSTHHQPLHQQETLLGVIISNKQATTKGHHLFLLPMYCLIPIHCRTIFQVPSLLAVPSVPEFTQRVSLTQNYIHSCTHKYLYCICQYVGGNFWNTFASFGKTCACFHPRPKLLDVEVVCQENGLCILHICTDLTSVH